MRAGALQNDERSKRFSATVKGQRVEVVGGKGGAVGEREGGRVKEEELLNVNNMRGSSVRNRERRGVV